MPGTPLMCGTCVAPRSVDPCFKCGQALTPVTEGWEWPAQPDLEAIRAAARECGYAIGLHGTAQRDFDLIAAPWTGLATTAPALVIHIARAVYGSVKVETLGPHGRLSYWIQPNGYIQPIDLSVMPLLPPATPREKRLMSVISRAFHGVYDASRDNLEKQLQEGVEGFEISNRPPMAADCLKELRRMVRIGRRKQRCLHPEMDMTALEAELEEMQLLVDGLEAVHGV